MDTFFFIASKLIGALLRPDTWIIIVLAIIVLTLKKQKLRLAMWISNVTFFALLMLAILPLVDLLLNRLIEVIQPILRSLKLMASSS